MGKTKKPWKAIVDEQLTDYLMDDETPAVRALSDNNLFFVDAKGNVGGESDLKRKRQKKLQESSTSSSSAATVTATTTSSSTSATTPSSPTKSSSSSSSSSSPSTSLVPVNASSHALTTKIPKSKRRKATWLARKHENLEHDKQRKQNLAKAGLQFASTELVDLWGERSPDYGVKLEKARNKGFEVDITPEESKKRVYLRQRPAKELEHSKELIDTSKLKVCVPGASFNPDEDQRQAALAVAYERDQRENAEAAAINAKLNPGSFVVENALKDDDDDGELLPAKTMPKAKSKAQRNTKLRLLKESYEREKEKAQSNIHKQIDRLPSVLSEIKNNEKKMAARKEALELKKQHPDHRPKISQHEYVAPFPEVPLEDDLTDRSLRCVKPCATLLMDRFKNLQERNIIEPRVRVTGKTRRYKLKQYTRNSHKDPRLTFGSKPHKT